MAKRYSHDYSDEDSILYAKGVDWSERAVHWTREFEQAAAGYLQGLDREDVGAVIVYRTAEGEEAAYFDYENMVGSVYELTGRRSDEI